MTARYGRYEVVRKLGEGAMAAVFLARDPVLSRRVAVKVLHANVAAAATPMKRFFNEARTVANLRNPHVVEVFDFGKEGRDYFLVMEFVDGQSMQGVLKQLRPPRPPTPAEPAGAAGEPLGDILTACLLSQAADGLDVASRHGVVHRDIKPENLMINQQGYLKVADFGIAHLQDDSLTRTGAVLGSPQYMSPEQVRGTKPITSQSDMFSLGAVLYRCLAGSPAFAAASLKDLYRKIASEAHPALWLARPDLDPSLAALVETLLQKDPERRGGGPRWLRSELRAWLLARGVDDPMEEVGRHLRSLAQRSVQTTWNQALGEGLPRTVAATGPLLVAEPTVAGYPSRQPAPESERPGLTMAWSAGAGKPGSRAWVYAFAGAFLLALGAGGGYLAARHGGAPAPAGAKVPASIPADGEFQIAEGRGGLAATHGIPAPPVDTPGSLPSEEAPEASTDPLAAPVPQPEPENAGTGTLLVQSSPPFAQVYLDGHYRGVTPLRMAGLAAGPHRLLLKGHGDLSLDTVIQVRPGKREARVRLDSRAIAFDSEE